MAVVGMVHTSCWRVRSGDQKRIEEEDEEGNEEGKEYE
jgi:hypothetical protein